MPAEAVARVPKPIFADGFLEDPYPTYRQFLNEGPLHYVALGPGYQAAFSYSLVSSLLKDPRFSSKRSGTMVLSLPPEQRAQFAPLVEKLGLWLLFMDPPEHSRLRKLLNKGFSPVVAEALRPRIERLVDRMLDDLSTSPEVEFMSRFAHAFPARVIAELLDVPEEMNDDLIRWSEAIAIVLGNPGRTVEQCAAGQDAVFSLTEFFRGVVAERRRQPGTDLISLLLEIEADGEVLTEDELHAQCILLLFGGHETTRNLIGNGILTLLQHPEQLERLRGEPNLIRGCVEEMLRFQSPVQFLARIAKEDLDLEGVPMKKGEAVMQMMGAANRDPKVFRDPDAFDPGRMNNVHLAFGAGPHFCIGNQIARLEAQTAILRTVHRFPKLGFGGRQPEWAQNYALRGLKSFPLRLS